MQDKFRVLLIEDDKIDQLAFERHIRKQNLQYEHQTANSIAEATKILQSGKFDVIITDFNLGDGTAFDVLKMRGSVPVILTTGAGDEEIAVKVMKEGAYDYLVKDQERNYLKIVPITIENALSHKKSKEQITMLSNAVMNINDSVYITNMDNIIIFVNNAFCKCYGYEKQNIIGQHGDILWKDVSESGHIKKTLMQNEKLNQSLESYHKRQNLQEFPVSLSGSTIKDENQNVFAIVFIARDITETKNFQDQLKYTINEKVILLKEIHHRVKNNMQIISSLLSLQADKIENRHAKRIFKDCQNRVKSMALVHERLYQSKDLSKINCQDYINKLTNYLFHSYHNENKNTNIITDVDDMYLNINNAIPCGLIINELVSNAFKYAFPDKKNGSIQVDLKKEENEKFLLSISDDGIGLPKNFDINNIETLGLQLVFTLVDQLNGYIDLSNQHGTSYKIQF